ncbi:von Willebrand factor type A domain-containing protein [Saccharicrinis sp. FJH62]|uniref:vWA domain-containing protein n=1 Tax=Saccharicrinis sp. FJH62 TaxID=3344657 RepID=UPI0035D4340B
MKKLFAVILTVLSVSPLLSQNIIRGKVLNENDNSPVFMVKITTAKELIYTDKGGEFQLLFHDSDSIITLQKDGFETLTFPAKSNGVNTIKLKPIAQVLDYEEDNMNTLYTPKTTGVATGKRVTKSRAEQKIVLQEAVAYDMAINYVVPPVYSESNTDEYSQFEESGFKAVRLHPLSTFSVDVDVASYAITRRHINNGMLPPPNSVRVEEMINYFKYHYPKPDNKEPLAVSLAADKCPWNPDHYLVRVGLQTKEIKTEKLPRSNFVFLIDISGSMSSPDKLPLAKASLKTFLGTLRNDDRVAIVTYAGSTRVALESTSVKNKQQITRALDNLSSGGSTAGAEGLKLAYSEAEKSLIKEGNNRIILVTDGDFNVGPSSVDDLKQLIKEKRDKGICISILGFGQGNLKDNRMEAIADNGNGNYGYVDNLQEAHKILMKEFSSNLFVVAKDVKIQVEFNPARVASYRLVGYDNRALAAEDFNNDKKDAGEMGADQQVTALYEISLVNSDGKPVVDPLRYGQKEKQEKAFMNELGTVKIRYKDPDSEVSKLIVGRIDDSILKDGNSDPEFRMAASVAMFGQILRKSDYVEKGDLSTVANMLTDLDYADRDGYKAEFLRLVELASKL